MGGWKTDLANALFAARTAQGMGQCALAQAANVARATIAQIETGQGDPRIETLDRIARALAIPTYLLTLTKPDLTALHQLMKPPNILSQKEAAAIKDLLKGPLRTRRQAIHAVMKRVPTNEAVGAAIGTILLPGVGTAVGAALSAAD